jgi:hypothetical protein
LGEVTRSGNGSSKKDIITSDVPEGLDWALWRVLSSTRMSVTLQEVRTHWTGADLYDALTTIEIFEQLERKAREDG